MNDLAKAAINEMSDEIKTAFLDADKQTQISLALSFAQDAVDKHETITNQLRSYPHKMAAFQDVVYDNLSAQ